MSNYPYFNPQQQQPVGLSGRYVNNANEIMANDVSMNGAYSFFPKNDMSELYAKCWLPNGSISTLVYKRVEDYPQMNTLAKIEDNSVTEQLEIINKRLDALEQAKKSTRARKVATDDE